MNYLQLCQRLRQECGGSGSGPQSVTNQIGENKLYVDWVNQAWREIQNVRQDWFFQWKQGGFDITEGATIITLPSDLNRMAVLEIGDHKVDVIDWPVYRQYYSQTLEQGRPTAVSFAPNGQLYLNKQADKNYSCRIDYYFLPQQLVNNTDIPTLPEEFHMIIVYKAMMYYGAYESAADVVGMGVSAYHNMMSDLEYKQLCRVDAPGPLA